MENNTTRHDGLVTYPERCDLLEQNSIVIWLTGLSGSGKSTLACSMEKFLFDKGYIVYRLDGDNIRQGLNSNLGFSEEDRAENIRRVAETAKLFTDAGVVTLVSFITPLESMRQIAASIIKDKYYEVFCSCSIEECISRDPKGLYKKALNGEIKDFTGIDANYEEPKKPFLVLDTETLSIEQSVLMLYEKIKKIISI